MDEYQKQFLKELEKDRVLRRATDALLASDVTLQLVLELFGEIRVRPRQHSLGRLFSEYMSRIGTPRRHDRPLIEGSSRFVVDYRLPRPCIVPASFYDCLPDHGRGLLERIALDDAMVESGQEALTPCTSEISLFADGTFCSANADSAPPGDRASSGGERHSLPYLKSWLHNARDFIGALCDFGVSLGRRPEFGSADTLHFIDEHIWLRKVVRVDFDLGAAYLPEATLPLRWVAQYESITVRSRARRTRGGEVVLDRYASEILESRADGKAGAHRREAGFQAEHGPSATIIDMLAPPAPTAPENHDFYEDKGTGRRNRGEAAKDLRADWKNLPEALRKRLGNGEGPKDVLMPFLDVDGRRCAKYRPVLWSKRPYQRELTRLLEPLRSKRKSRRRKAKSKS